MECRAHHQDSRARYFHFTVSGQKSVTISLSAGALYVPKGTPNNGWGAAPKGTYEHRREVRRTNGKLLHDGPHVATAQNDSNTVTLTLTAEDLHGGGGGSIWRLRRKHCATVADGGCDTPPVGNTGEVPARLAGALSWNPYVLASPAVPAGLGAAFVAAASPKLRPGEGRLALVLPGHGMHRKISLSGPDVWSGTRILEGRRPKLTTPSKPIVGPVDAVVRGFRKYANFGGRATRAEYWWWIFVSVGGLGFWVIGLILGTGLPQLFFGVAVLLPTSALTTRRLHDIGKSGLWKSAWLAVRLVSGVLMFIATGDVSDEGIKSKILSAILSRMD